MRELFASARFRIFIILLLLLVPLFFLGAYSMQRECECFREPCNCSNFSLENGFAVCLYGLLPSVLIAWGTVRLFPRKA